MWTFAWVDGALCCSQGHRSGIEKEGFSWDRLEPFTPYCSCPKIQRQLHTLDKSMYSRDRALRFKSWYCMNQLCDPGQCPIPLCFNLSISLLELIFVKWPQSCLAQSKYCMSVCQVSSIISWNNWACICMLYISVTSSSIIFLCAYVLSALDYQCLITWPWNLHLLAERKTSLNLCLFWRLSAPLMPSFCVQYTRPTLSSLPHLSFTSPLAGMWRPLPPPPNSKVKLLSLVTSNFPTATSNEPTSGLLVCWVSPCHQTLITLSSSLFPKSAASQASFCLSGHQLSFPSLEASPNSSRQH